MKIYSGNKKYINTRPTTNKVKEAIFCILFNKYSFPKNCTVLDLFAGFGSLGLESASCGALKVYLVESSLYSFRICVKNACKLNSIIGKNIIKAIKQNVKQYIKNNVINNNKKKCNTIKWDLVFLDPPYTMSKFFLKNIIIDTFSLLSNRGIIILEKSVYSNFLFSSSLNLSIAEYKRYGDTEIYFLKKIY